MFLISFSSPAAPCLILLCKSLLWQTHKNYVSLNPLPVWVHFKALKAFVKEMKSESRSRESCSGSKASRKAGTPELGSCFSHTCVCLARGDAVSTDLMLHFCLKVERLTLAAKSVWCRMRTQTRFILHVISGYLKIASLESGSFHDSVWWYVFYNIPENLCQM